MHLTTPQNAFTNRPARPLLQKFFRCAGQIAAPCGARYLSWGEARRKRLQARTKSTKTRSSPRRFWKSRSRSSILHGAPARQLAMHWATPGEQWLLPLRHSSSGAWLKPCPWLGIQLGQRLTLTALFAALFAAASSPPHLPMHPRPLQVVARRFTPRRAPDRRPPPSTPLVATLIAAAASRPPCRATAIAPQSAVPVRSEVLVCGRGCAHVRTVHTSHVCGNRRNFLRGAPPRTPLGLAPQTPMKNEKWCPPHFASVL